MSEHEIIDATLAPAAPSAPPTVPPSAPPAAIAVIPTPRCAVNVRAATAADLPFIDALQKMHSHMVGFLRYGEIEKHIAKGIVLIAEETPASGVGDAVSVGYVIARDTYMKREEVGIIYQLNVQPIRHRHLVGATLVRACFEKAAYGCRLFCCWCAQDIQANWFWESLGFVPLAFRTGSRAKQRIHIFWQRRVRDERNTGETPVPPTPYWFPSKTEGGGVGEDRIVLPIPPDAHWRDAKPTLLPGLPAPMPEMPALLPGGQPVRARPAPQQPKLSKSQKAAIMRSQSAHLGGVPLGKKAVMRGGRIKYVEREDYVPELDAPEELMAAPKPKRTPKPRQKHDPAYEAAARELRDRYLEEVNTNRMLPAAWGAGADGGPGKYDVSRQLPVPDSAFTSEPIRLLPAKAA